MTDLIRMVYASTTTNPVDAGNGGVPRDVGRVLMQSRKNNPNRQIGGVLFFSNNFYFQCLEGQQEDVDALIKKIAADPRHNRVETLYVKHVQDRLFSNWSMKYVVLDRKVERIVKESGHGKFDPYKFDKQLIEKILQELAGAHDSSGQRVEQPSQHTAGSAQGFWSRLFKRGKAA